MELDKTLIKHWANLCESNEMAGLDSSVDEAGMSLDDILGAHEKKKAADDEAQKKEQERKDAEQAARQIKRITITKVSEDGSIEYTIERNDGSKTDEKSSGYDDDDEQVKKMRWKLKQMAGKSPDDYDVYVALLRTAYDSFAKHPIQWSYSFDRGEGDLDEDWYFSPNEDYFGMSKADIDAMIDSGWRHPLVTG